MERLSVAVVAPLAGMPESRELQKMYFLPETGGEGLAKVG